jgi:UPF0755 protein
MRKLTTAILIAIILGGLIFGFMTLSFLYSPRSDNSTPVVFEVAPGHSFHAVGRDLVEKGLISSEKRLRILAKIVPELAKVRVGEYELNAHMTPLEILSILRSGKSVLHLITFPEGMNRFEMAALIEEKHLVPAADFLAATQDKKLIKTLLDDAQVSTLEGYLYPETYSFTKFTGANGIVTAMVEKFLFEFKNVVGSTPLPYRGLSRHQLVILASMIEKETGAPLERPVIASVFYNRLAKNMKLQSDPTTMYGYLVATGKTLKNITRNDLLRPTPYNTYTVPSLPFGPIGNPGREALAAAIKPVDSGYFFFVSHNDGTHQFSGTLADHNNAVKKFQLDPLARAGKSWRDLGKKKAEAR